MSTLLLSSCYGATILQCLHNLAVKKAYQGLSLRLTQGMHVHSRLRFDPVASMGNLSVSMQPV